MHEKRDLIIGCDDAAIEFKNELKKFLADQGYAVEDMGVASRGDSTVYPEVAGRVCKAIIDGGYRKRGILICGTGIGMAMSANKFPGIRAAQVHDVFSAERAALSNDANVITMGARVIGVELAKKLVMAWLPLEFAPGPSTPKVEAIKSIEKRNFRD
ncbi:MAG: RpiB/LacA/LacB family sugar-phosphate isomerase [Planctomycetota bacterium]|nr:RpiB/LacA/LacB family sugar-phosphate isomerase [Planctomycetota bacterium]